MNEDDELSQSQTFSRMRLDMEIVKRDVSDVKTTLDKLCIAILGDGDNRPGIVRQMDAIKTAIAFNSPAGSIDDRVTKLENQVKEITNSLDSIRKAAWTFVAAFILFGASFVWSLLTHQISIHIP